MSEKNRSVVRMNFADGSKIDAWTSFSLRDTFTDPLGSLEFEARPPREKIGEYTERLAKGELVSVLVNETPQCVAIIQEVTKSVGRDGVAFRMRCVSPLVTPYQGSVDPDLSLHRQSDVSVEDAILQALAPYGLSAIIADNRSHVEAISGKPIGNKAAKTTVSALKHRDAQAQDGESAYAFCSRIFNRLGVVLRLAWNGQLMIGAPDYEQDALYSLVQDFDHSHGGDRFLADPALQIIDSNDGQFSDIIVRGTPLDAVGQKQTARPDATVKATTISATRPAYTSTAAAFKPLYVKDKNARDITRCDARARLEHGTRAANAFRIVGEVDGFVAHTGAIWTVDTIADVRVDAHDLHEDMWILERVFAQSRDRGQRTRLTLLPRGALVLGSAA